MKLLSFADGWKTYLVVVIGVGLGVAQSFGIHIPNWVDVTLGFLGMGAMRAGVTKSSAVAAVDIEELVRLVAANIVVPSTTTVNVNSDSTMIPVPKPAVVEVHNLPPIK